MSVSVRQTSAVNYLDTNYPDLPTTEIPPPLRDKTRPSADYRGSPYELIRSWGFFSSPYAFTVSCRKVPIKGVPSCHDAVLCVMEPRPMSAFEKVTAIGSTQLVAANACCAKLIATYAKMPDSAKSMLGKFLGSLPKGANLLFSPSDLAELESFIRLPADQPILCSSSASQSKSLQLSLAIERTIYANDSTDANWTVETNKGLQTQRDQNSNSITVLDADECIRNLPQYVKCNSKVSSNGNECSTLVDLEPLRNKIKLNQQLKNKQMKDYAWILNRANTCRDARFKEFYLKDSMTPEELLAMEPIPNIVGSQDISSILPDIASCIPSVAVKQMKLKGPNIRTTSIPKKHTPRCSFFPAKVIHLIVDKISPPFVFYASCKMLALEAATAKYLQLCYRHTETPRRLLWNYIISHFRSAPVILFRPRLLEDLAVSLHPLPKRLQPCTPDSVRAHNQKERDICRKPNLEMKNKLMRRRVAYLQNELKKVQSENVVPYSMDFETAFDSSVTSSNRIKDLLVVSEVFNHLNKHPFVNSITLAYVTNDETQKREVEITLNDIYVFRETASENLQKGIIYAVKKAKILMEAIEKRGCEDVIPHGQRFDTKLLIALLELKTGLSIENISIQFRFDVENESWKAESTIDGVYCGTSSPHKTQKEALDSLLSSYLIEKQSCFLLKM